jgi:hypothetical protein
MRLYIETMDAVLVEIRPDGRIRLEHEEWSKPTVQETRAILHAARTEIENLSELMIVLESMAR